MAELTAIQRLRLLGDLRKQRVEAEAIGTGPAAALKKLKIAKAIRDIRQQLGLGVEKATDPAGAGGLGVTALTGKELGDFPDTDEGKKALRAAAKASLLALRGKMIPCQILGEPVEMRKRGIKETMRFSANPDKLKMIAAIESIIGTASGKSWEENYKKETKPEVAGYFTLKSSVSVGDRTYVVDVLIEKDIHGLLHYDLIIDRAQTKAALDSASSAAAVAERPRITNPGYSVDSSINEGNDEGNLLLDSAVPGRMVLNLFVEGEGGDTIVESDEEPDGGESPDIAKLRRIAAGEYDKEGLDGLQTLYGHISMAVEALNAAALLSGDAEDAANAAITHWAELEERVNG